MSWRNEHNFCFVKWFYDPSLFNNSDIFMVEMKKYEPCYYISINVYNIEKPKREARALTILCEAIYNIFLEANYNKQSKWCSICWY